MIIPRNLVYKERKLDEFDIDEEGSIDKILYDKLIEVEGLFAECPNTQSRGEQFQGIFNDVYYIVTLSNMYSRPEDKLHDFVSIAGQPNWSAKHYNCLSAKSQAVMGMVYAILLYFKDDEKKRRLANTIFVEMFKGKEYECVATNMRESILSAWKIPRFDFKPLFFSKWELSHIEWNNYVRLYYLEPKENSVPEIDNPLGILDFSLSSEIDELLFTLGRNRQEKYDVIDALEEYIQNNSVHEDSKWIYNYDSALAYLQFKRGWIKYNVPLGEQEPQPQQLIIPEMIYIYEKDYTDKQLQDKTDIEDEKEPENKSITLHQTDNNLKEKLDKALAKVAELEEEIEQLKQDIAELEKNNGLATMPRAAIFYAATRIINNDVIISKEALAQAFRVITGLGGENGERVRQAFSESKKTTNKFTNKHKEEAINAIKEVIPKIAAEIKKIDPH